MKMISDYFEEFTITRGDEFTFLGMNFKLDRENKCVKVSLIDQIEEVLEMLGEDIAKTVNSPVYTDVFVTYGDKCSPLDKVRKEKFHSIVWKLFFITKRSRPDIDIAFLYLTTRVLKSNECDWYKMKRVLSFFKLTFHMKGS